jgi:hypothetical protein
MLNEFIEYLEAQVKNGSIYVWGAQGEKNISKAWIRERETSERNAKRAINLWQKRVKEGYNALRAYDCSGLGMYFLFDMKGVFKEDTNAHGMMTMKCDRISRDELKRGDWVFRVSYGRAYHIGYVVDDELNVIEAMGRDSGVVKRAIDASGKEYWNAYGRPKCFLDEIVIEKSRLLKLTSPYMRGQDVLELQSALHKAGYPKVTGDIDGIFGSATQAGVRKFQKAKKLTVDGIAGEKTCRALGLEWR